MSDLVYARITPVSDLVYAYIDRVWRDSTEVERSLRNLVLDSIAGSRVRTRLKATTPYKNIKVNNLSFEYKLPTRKQVTRTELIFKFFNFNCVPQHSSSAVPPQ